MTVVDDITRELEQADTVVESTFGHEGMRRYALEAGTRICMIPAVRAARVDSAELVGFIFNTVEARPHLEYDELAHRIVNRFGLDKES
jgi:hypothetical protein